MTFPIASILNAGGYITPKIFPFKRRLSRKSVIADLKAKAKTALEDDEKSAIYARRKVEVGSVFGHIKGNRSFRRFSLRGLEKVYVEFGIVALAHNLLKVAGIRLATFLHKQFHKKSWSGHSMGSLQLFYFRDLLDSPFFMLFLPWKEDYFALEVPIHSQNRNRSLDSSLRSE
ncbi:transposase [Paenibacillus oceani]|uniref:Transposase n=1 Tax=Paenibacillus oceani TaxID=2772510 RepID=A0A927CD56_9BACL|nr:transposase [Paenibacillus oceani]